jgi:hypothetical protein
MWKPGPNVVVREPREGRGYWKGEVWTFFKRHRGANFLEAAHRGGLTAFATGISFQAICSPLYVAAPGAWAITWQFLSVSGPADGSAGMANGGSGHAAASDQCPAGAASEADLRERAGLRNRRRRYGLRRRRDGDDEAGSSNQPDHSYPPLFYPYAL